MTIRMVVMTLTASLSLPVLAQTTQPSAPAGTKAAPAANTTAPAAATAAPASNAAPQAAGQAQITAGAQVSGPQGAPVGTIASVDGDFAVVKTDKYDVRLPKTSFAAGPNGLVIGLSRDALNASVEQSLGKLDDVLKAGASVNGAQGTPVGTVEAVEGDLVTVKLTSGKSVRLPKSGFAPGPNGLVIGLTAQQLEQAAAGAGGG